MLPLSALLNPSGTPPGASVPHSSVTINHPPPDPFVSLDTMPPRVRSGALRRTVAVDPTPSMSGSPARHTSHRPPHNAVATSPMAFEGRVSPLPPPMNKGKGKAVDRGEPQSPSTVPVQGLAAAVQNVPGEGVPTGLEEDADFEFDEEFEDEDHPVYRYPPVAPFDADDPAWVHKMMDTLRQQHEDVAEHARTAHTRMAEATVELALARAELEEETRQMDEFLAAVGAEAGPSFLRYLMWRFEQDEDDAEAPHESGHERAKRAHGGDEEGEERPRKRVRSNEPSALLPAIPVASPLAHTPQRPRSEVAVPVDATPLHRHRHRQPGEATSPTPARPGPSTRVLTPHSVHNEDAEDVEDAGDMEDLQDATDEDALPLTAGLPHENGEAGPSNHHHRGRPLEPIADSLRPTPRSQVPGSPRQSMEDPFRVPANPHQSPTPRSAQIQRPHLPRAQWAQAPAAPPPPPPVFHAPQAPAGPAHNPRPLRRDYTRLVDNGDGSAEVVDVRLLEYRRAGEWHAYRQEERLLAELRGEADPYAIQDEHERAAGTD